MKIPIIVSIVLILLSCSTNDNAAPSKFTDQAITIHRSTKPGSRDLFDENNLSQNSKTSTDKITDNSDHDYDDSQLTHDSHSNKQKDNHHPNHPKHKQTFTFENEPPISAAQLSQLTTCPVPKLNLTKPVITTNVQWQIFVHCVLDILPDNGDHDFNSNDHNDRDHKEHDSEKNSKNNNRYNQDKTKQSANKNNNHSHDNNNNQTANHNQSIESAYPQITAMDKRQDAYKFLKRSLKKYFQKYLFHNPDLANEQKSAMFERIFLVTKFRPLTQSEKELVDNLIARKGLYYTSIIFCLNWYFSDFFRDHFDFSLDPQGEYNSHEFYGKIINENNQPVDNIKYKIPAEDLFGFETSGVSKFQSGFLTKVKNFFVQNQGSEYNFHLQFYLPADANESGATGTADLEIPLMTESNEVYDMKFASVKITGLITPNVEFKLAPKPVLPPGETPPPDTSPRWPDADTTVNVDIESLNWNISPGAVLKTCTAPGLITGGSATVVDGYAWQDFLTCYLKTDISQIIPGWDYFPLNDKRSAFSLMLAVIEQFKKSDLALYLTEPEIGAALFEAVIFQQTSANDLFLISASIDKVGLDQTLMSLVEKWYYSAIYSNYDYSQYNMPALAWYSVQGGVNESNGTVLANTNIRMQTMDGALVAETDTDTAGLYTLRFKAAQVILGQNLTLIVNRDGYGARELPIMLSENKLISLDIILNPLGTANETIGGQVVSANSEIVVTIPPGAVTGDVQFMITQSEMKPVPEVSTTNGLYFEIMPSYSFASPVNLTLNIESLIAQNPEARNWYIFTQSQDGPWELVENTLFDPVTGTIQAKIDHFSVIYISQINPNYTIPDTGASIVERRVITYPTDVPSLIPYAKQKMAGTWDTSALDNLEFYEGTGCTGKADSLNCQPLEKTAAIDITYSGSTITGTALVKGTVKFDLQAEQCKINPEYSIPQLRVMNISGTNLTLDVNLHHSNVHLSGLCYKDNTYIVKYWSLSCLCNRTKYVTVPEIYSCSVQSDHDSQFKLSYYNASFKRTAYTGPYEWQFLNQSYNVSMNWVKISDANSLEQEYIKKVKSAIQEQALDTLKNTLTTELNDRRGHIEDPVFDERYCDYFSPPAISLLNIERYYMTYINDGFTTSNITWTSELSGDYTVKVNAACNSTVPDKIQGSVSGNVPLVSQLKGEWLNEGLNTIHICVNRQYHKTGDKSFTIIQDNKRPVVSINVNNPDYHEFVSSTGGFGGTKFFWQSDYSGPFHVKVNNADCGNSLRDIQTGGNGYAMAGASQDSMVLAGELATGINPVNICVTGRNGLSGITTLNIFRDDIAPVTLNSPLAGTYDHAQIISLSCTDTACLKTAYTTDGTDPSFDINGNILHGSQYSAPWTTPDPVSTAFKFQSIDKAGNIEPLRTAVYTVDSNIPQTLISANEHDSLSVGDSISSSNLTWTSSRAGLEYFIRVGGFDCASGELIETGTTLLGEMNSYIPVDKLLVGNNLVRICVKNLIGNFSSIEQSIARYENEPLITISNKSRNYLSYASGYSESKLTWTGTQSGSYKIKVNSTCDDALNQPVESGDFSKADNLPVISTVAAASLVPGTNIFRICLTNRNNQTNEASGTLYLDTTPPNTLSNITSGTFGSAQNTILSCVDNVKCKGIVYTLDGSDPQYPDTGVVVDNASNSQSLTVNVMVGGSSNGTFTLKYKAIDLAGNEEGLKRADVTIDSAVATVSINPGYADYLSLNGKDSSSIEWRVNRNGNYAVKKGGSCARGVELTGLGGVIYNGALNITSIQVALLDGGNNLVRICVTDEINRSTEGVVILTRDDTAPVTNNVQGDGAYGLIQEVSLNCTDNCLKTIYTTDGSDPQISINGDIINGMEAASSWFTPDLNNPSETITTLKFKSVDRAGNIEDVRTSFYTIDSTLPTVTIVSSQGNVIANVPGHDSTEIMWQVNRDNLDYFVEIGGTTCENGTLSQESLTSKKTTASRNIISTILARELSEGDNLIRICVRNLASKYGYSSYRLTRSDTMPTVTLVQANQHDFVSINGYVSTVFQWQSDVYGDYYINTQGDCRNGTLSGGYHNMGSVTKNVPITSEILAGNLNSGPNSVHVCVKGQNNLKSERTLSITRDDTAPDTRPQAGSGSYGAALNIVLSCSDNCAKTTYSIDRMDDPQIDLAGNILNNSASLYQAPISLQDQRTTVLKYRSLDLAGNIEEVKTSQYTIDTDLPGISITTPNPYYIGSNGSSTFSWTAERINLPYYIYLNAAGCGTGTLLENGSVTGNPNPFTITGTSLSSGSNTILICESNLVGDYGYSSTTVFLDTLGPTITPSWGGTDFPQYTISCSDTDSGCQRITYTYDKCLFYKEETYCCLDLFGHCMAYCPRTVCGEYGPESYTGLTNTVTLDLNFELNTTISISASDYVGNITSISENICVKWGCLEMVYGCGDYCDKTGFGRCDLIIPE